MSLSQSLILRQAAMVGLDNPSLLSDLEGAGMVAELEQGMARILGTRHVLAVSSGTAALHAALLALGIGRGDEVIVSPYSWGQSVSPVLFVGATPVFADILPDTLCIDPRSVRERISRRTRAILPVHLFGSIVPMEPLLGIAKKHCIAVIADAAHALGAEVEGRSAAVFGDVCCFSLGRGKLVSGGEGGLLATNDTGLFQRAMAITQHPSRTRREFGPECEMLYDLGYNYRIHPLAAALALASLGDLPLRLGHRRRVWNAFQHGLGTETALRNIPCSPPDSWAAYGIALSWEGEPAYRQEIAARAQELGLPLRCGPVKTPLHLRISQAALPFKVKRHFTHLEGACPIAEAHCKHKEIWALSATDMDTLLPAEAHAMGEKLQALISPYVAS